MTNVVKAVQYSTFRSWENPPKCLLQHLLAPLQFREVPPRALLKRTERTWTKDCKLALGTMFLKRTSWDASTLAKTRRHSVRPENSSQSADQRRALLWWTLLVALVSNNLAWGLVVRGAGREPRNGKSLSSFLQGQAPPSLETGVSALQVSSPALFAGQAGAGSLDLMPDTEEQVAMLPNCMFFQAYPGSCIPDTAHAPCR